jgi:hypothetical protein
LKPAPVWRRKRVAVLHLLPMMLLALFRPASPVPSCNAEIMTCSASVADDQASSVPVSQEASQQDRERPPFPGAVILTHDVFSPVFAVPIHPMCAGSCLPGRAPQSPAASITWPWEPAAISLRLHPLSLSPTGAIYFKLHKLSAGHSRRLDRPPRV